MSSEDYLIVAAIDFGTTFSGFAFSTRNDFVRDPTKVASQTWTASTGNLQSLKTSTCILFNPEQEFDKFGFDAEDKFIELALENQHHEWFYFRRFKMKLYQNTMVQNDFELESESGRTMTALKVFSEAIRYLKRELMSQCEKQQTGVSESDIKWVVTVPAIWTDTAKTFMRTAAEMAGIKDMKLEIVLEPEAAAMFVKHLPISMKAEGHVGDSFKAFSPGSKYLVCDAGGGTIDIAVHEVLDGGQVGEMRIPSGGDWGGTKVDEEYMKFLEEIGGRSAITEFIRKEKMDLMELYREFEIKKRTIRKGMDGKITIKFPASYKSIYEKMNSGKSLQDETSKSKKFQNKLRWISDKLQFSPELAQSFFKKSTEKICDHLQQILNNENTKDVNYILLVGGYAESPMLQAEIKEKFPSKRLIVPQEAGLSVLKGAVMLGHDPLLICTRIAKYTYGVACSYSFIEGKHREEYKFERDDEVKCANIFEKYVTIGESINVNEFQSEKYYAKFSDQETVTFPIFATTDENPEYTTDKGCFKVGEMKLHIPEGKQLGKSKLKIRMSFSGTELKAQITCLATGKTSTEYLDHSVAS